MLLRHLQMGIKLEAKDVAITNAPKRSGTEKRLYRFTTADLPFPRGKVAAYCVKWQKDFRARILDWAGTVKKPFAANSNPQFAAEVAKNWLEVYPDLAEHSESAIVLGVVREL